MMAFSIRVDGDLGRREIMVAIMDEIHNEMKRVAENAGRQVAASQAIVDRIKKGDAAAERRERMIQMRRPVRKAK